MTCGLPNHRGGVVTLLTDFGLTDPFVGVMKGVILSRHDRARLVDLTHGIPPQDIAAAAFWIAQAWRYFPQGSVHLVVVDPGVGSERETVVVEVGGHRFVGPNNGVFSGLPESRQAYRIVPERLGLAGLSATFHGRDLFAPVAAELSRGAIRAQDVGPETQVAPGLPTQLSLKAGSAEGAVVVVDHFGNAITNLIEAALPHGKLPDRKGQLGGASMLKQAVVEVGGQRLALARRYEEVPLGAPLALVNSWGVIEIAVRNGNACEFLGIERGTKVRLVLST